MNNATKVLINKYPSWNAFPRDLLKNVVLNLHDSFLIYIAIIYKSLIDDS